MQRSIVSTLFESSTINGMHLANRFVRSATWEGMAHDDGSVTPKLIDTMSALAAGGVGLIISSHAYVSPAGQATPWQIGIYRDELLPGLTKMAAAVHAHGGKIVMQLAHAGAFAMEKLTGLPAYVVSDFEGLAASRRHEIGSQEVAKIVKAFAAGARRAQAAGFDGVQLHSAHGYLLSQFLSPYFNRRRDDYGGDLPARTKIHVEILHAVRQAVGPDYPVLIKMNCRDFQERGLPLEESLEAAKILAAAGLDAIELSGGLLTGGNLSPSRPGIDSVDKEAYFKQEARTFKQALDLPLILVGGIRSLEVAEQLVTDGTADYISMSRPFIWEPDLIKRWQAGDRRKAACNSDNLCFRPGFRGEGIYCVTRKRQQAKSAKP
jgi:2,4-dienoyl-CoA reductase-like NADH-dependent reductase (Old Yellow Enzyme family)